MGVFEQFPYTNWHELNLDWFIKEFERLQSEWDSFGYTVTATAHPGLTPSVTVTGDLTNGLNFDFTLVKGDTGATGATGPAGNGIASVSIDGSYQLTFTFTDGTVYTTPSLRGPQGAGLEVLDEYATLTDLQTAHPVGSAGDMYLVGTSPNFTLYLWSPSQNAWVDGGALTSPSPTVTTPLMDGLADVGLEFTYARGDHVHPTDTSRASQTDLDAANLAISTKASQTDLTNLTNRVSTNENNISLLTSGKQDKLINETNIKSVNGTTLLGTGSLSTGNALTNNEVATHDTFNGDTVYEKIIDVGLLPSSGVKATAHGISNLGTVISMVGVASNGTINLALPFVSPTNVSNQILVQCDATNLSIQVASSAWSTYYATVVMRYTKTA